MSTDKECTTSDGTWRIDIAKDADKKIRSLDASTRRRIGQRLDQMRVNPYAVAKPLEGWGNLWSSRVGGWRLICTITVDVKVVAVVWIARRGQVYDDLEARF